MTYLQGCTGKIAYVSSNAAHRVCSKLPKDAFPYRCHFCAGWHISRSKVDKTTAERWRLKKAPRHENTPER